MTQLTHPYTVLFESGIWTVIGQNNGTVRLIGTSLKARTQPHPDIPLVHVLKQDEPAPRITLKRYTTDAGMFSAGMDPTTFQWYLIIAQPNALIPDRTNYLSPLSIKPTSPA